MTKDQKRANAFANALQGPEWKPADYFFLTLEGRGDDAYVSVKYKGTHGGDVTRRIKDHDDYQQFMRSKEAECIEYGMDPEKVSVMCSSSLDFPHEYTDNREVIELCQRIRGANEV